MGYTKYIIALLLCLLGILQQPVAQVNVTIGVTPPYSPYLSNYTSRDANKIFLTLQNTTTGTLQVRLAGSAVGDNGVAIRSRPGFVSSQMITLAPRQIRQLNGTALSEIFDLNNFDVTGIDRNTLARTLRLPEGNYNLCVQALDYNSGRPLSAGAPTGCALLAITYPEPPVLVSPLPGDSVNAATPQTVIFSWMNPGAVPPGTEYTLQIQEMPARNANPNQVLISATFPLLSQKLRTTSYVYNVGNLALKKGSYYAWRVVASDPTGKTNFKNEGISAAAVFKYGRTELLARARDERAAPEPARVAKGNAVSVSGVLHYRYRSNNGTLPASFKGIKTDSIPLANEQLQLCYGLCKVKMNIQKKVVTQTVSREALKNMSLPTGVTINYSGRDSARLTFLQIDSVPVSGAPMLMPGIQPAGLSSNGLGEVIATTTTDNSGGYAFNTTTFKRCYISDAFSDGTAMIYCYYVNVKNKHYTDPFVYAYAPDDENGSFVNLGFSKVFIDNYVLQVNINRNKEFSTDQGKSQQVSVENKADNMVDVYILRKGTPLPTQSSYTKRVPATEGDNSGQVGFASQSDIKPAFLQGSKYYIVAKRTVITHQISSLTNPNNFQANAEFYNLVNNLGSNENYYIYAEYKGSSVYFTPQEFGFQPYANVAEYRPIYVVNNTPQKVSMKPAYVSIKVKGVMKYQFKGGNLTPLANVKVSFQSVLWQNDKGSKLYDYENKYGHNRVYATTTTSSSGYFELNAGMLNYNDYSTGNALLLGLDQIITVNNPYYGSPDNAFRLQAGNTYNLGELVAQVKDYSYTAIISGKNANNGLIEPLAGQRVFLCRKASVNPKSWGVPADEGVKKNLPQEKIKDADNTWYNVIGYGQAGSDGKVMFSNLVAKDFNNADDQYYIYSESGITSVQNYSTQYGLKAGIGTFQKASWTNYYNKAAFVFNADVRKKAREYANTFEAKPLAPFIEGGVYPQTNTSTNALPGVKVRIYNVSTSLTAESIEKTIEDYGVEMALWMKGFENKLQIQETQTTGSDGRFYFGDPTVQGKYKGWKLLAFFKDGFVSNYEVINAGKPMVAGVKETVKGFLLPPQIVHTTVKDAETGEPVAANIVVGDQFSWAEQKVLYNYNFTTKKTTLFTTGVDLTTPYGNVTFTVIPDDNVHYRTQTFQHKVKAPADKTQQVSGPSQTLPDFELYSRRNRISVCLLDAKTKKGLPGTVTIMDVADAVNPAIYPVLLKKDHCKEFSFVSAQSSYRVQITSAGYATKTLWVNNNSNDDIPKDLMVYLEPAVTIQGKVVLNGQPLKDAKVYIKELGNLPAVYTDASGNYKLDGAPQNNATVTVMAVKPGSNVIGQGQAVKLDNTSTPTSSGSGGGTTANVNIGQGNYSATGNYSNNLSGNNNWAAGAHGNSSQNLQVVGVKQIDFTLTENKDFDLTQLYGFPLEVEGFVTNGITSYLTGRISVPANKAFNGKETYLHFSKIKLSKTRNKGSMPLATASGEVEVDNDDVPVKLFGMYDARLKGYQAGVKITSYNKSTDKGIVTGTVTMKSGSVAANVQWQGSVSLNALASAEQAGGGMGMTKLVDPKSSDFLINVPVENSIPVFVSHADMAGSITGYYSFKNKEGTLRYCLNKIYKTDTYAKSYVDKDGLHLFSTIHTRLENVTTPDIKLGIGEVKVTSQAMAPVEGNSDITIPLDDWNIKSKKWSINNGALELDGDIEAGSITVPAKGLVIGETSIGFGDLKLDKIAIAGVYKLNIVQSQTMVSFGYDKAAQYGTLYDKKYGCWSLSLLPKNANDALTQLTGLHDMAASDKLHIMNISLYSKGGESRIILKQNHPSVTLNGFAGFVPFEVENGKDFLKVNGALSFSIPGFTGTESAPYSLNYTDSAGKLIHKHSPIAGLRLTTNGIRTEFSTADQIFTGGMLQLKGVLRDKVSNSPYALNVIFSKKNNYTRIVVDTTRKDVISLGGSQQMKRITGMMSLIGQTWLNFKFEGDVLAEGMAEDKPTHMGFEVKGDLVANKTELGVKNMPFPYLPNSAFNLTYDFDKKAVVGSLQLTDMKTPAADFDAAVEMQLGGGEWYMLGSVSINKLKIVPLPLNGAGAAFCLGSTSITPQKLQIIQPVFHNGILPNDFSSKFSAIKGALFVAAVDLKLPLPTLDIDIGVANVHVGYGIYGNAYAGLNFDETAPIVDGGLKVGAYVNVNGGASIGIACAGVSLAAEINAQGNLHLELPALKGATQYVTNPVALLTDSKIDVNVEMGAQLGGSAYVGAGVCNSSCNSVKVWGVTVPPGCHKKGIGKTMSVSGGITITKNKGAVTPDQAVIYVNLLDKPYSATIPVPNL
ncbi:hypothetical protein HNQ91_005389 [Filimonas zeae]|uniref:TANFOR domain-containing protein n=1 Tax=Filimonas zeae TaxID=1737353 RepID=A0A917J590_9BACT|nr:hypothetical protein [Filimonas zeae]MDR6342305.1 hypothetical protein [Filimonas zeae]GGH80800.1 hypothetical protein GCM10011379_52210 [Filimonas zeae]